MNFEQLSFESSFIGLDLGEGKNHIMARAFGLKTDRKAKCKSCVFNSDNTCSLLTGGVINKENAACSRYQSKNSRRTIKKLEKEGSVL